MISNNMNRFAVKILITALIILIASSVSYSATKTTIKKTKTTVKKAVVKKAPLKKVATQEVEWAAKVNGDILPMEWYNRLLDASKVQISKDMSLEAAESKGIIKDTKKAIIEQMIESAVLLQWAEREGIELQDNSIKFKIKELKKKFPSSQEFHKSLSEQGMNVTDLERDLKKQIIVDKLIMMRAKTLAVSDEEIKSFYDKNIDLYIQNPQLHLQQLYFKDPASAETTLATFAVKKEFEGEDMGRVEKGQLPINNDSSLFSLKAGDISDVISGEAGYYIFKVVERFPGRETKLADAKEPIRKFLLIEKARLQYIKDLQQEKANAKIILNEKLGELF